MLGEVETPPPPPPRGPLKTITIGFNFNTAALHSFSVRWNEELPMVFDI